MRRANAILTSLIMILFLIHIIWGSLELAGFTRGGNSLFSFLSRAMILLIFFHVVISLKMTGDTILAWRRSGVSYWRENRIFWVRRISGLALMIFIAIHVYIFSGQKVEGVYLLHFFGIMELLSQILMVVSLLVHLLTNIRPLKIAFGIEDRANIRTDLILVLAILLLLSAVAFALYYLRWLVI